MPLKLYHHCASQKIVESDRYEYLGIILDKNLNPLSQFDKMYKKYLEESSCLQECV